MQFLASASESGSTATAGAKPTPVAGAPATAEPATAPPSGPAPAPPPPTTATAPSATSPSKAPKHTQRPMALLKHAHVELLVMPSAGAAEEQAVPGAEAVVGSVVKVVLRCPAGFASTTGAELAPTESPVWFKIGPVEWLFQNPLSADRTRWHLVPSHARPFPWDPHELRIHADLVGYKLRARCGVVDIFTEQPVLVPRRATRAPSSAIAPGVAKEPLYLVTKALPQEIALSPSTKAFVTKVVATPRFGFHGQAASAPTALVVLCGTGKPIPAADAAEVLWRNASATGSGGGLSTSASTRALSYSVEIREVPSADSEAVSTLLTVWFTAAAYNVCDLAPEDEVSLIFHPDAIAASAVPSAIAHLTPTAGVQAPHTVDDDDESEGAASAPPAATQNPGMPASPLDFRLVLRSREDRDNVAIALRAWHGKQLRSLSNEAAAQQATADVA